MSNFLFWSINIYSKEQNLFYLLFSCKKTEKNKESNFNCRTTKIT